MEFRTFVIAIAILIMIFVIIIIAITVNTRFNRNKVIGVNKSKEPDSNMNIENELDSNINIKNEMSSNESSNEPNHNNKDISSRKRQRSPSYLSISLTYKQQPTSIKKFKRTLINPSNKPIMNVKQEPFVFIPQQPKQEMAQVSSNVSIPQKPNQEMNQIEQKPFNKPIMNVKQEQTNQEMNQIEQKPVESIPSKPKQEEQRPVVPVPQKQNSGKMSLTTMKAIADLYIKNRYLDYVFWSIVHITNQFVYKKDDDRLFLISLSEGIKSYNEKSIKAKLLDLCKDEKLPLNKQIKEWLTPNTKQRTTDRTKTENYIEKTLKDNIPETIKQFQTLDEFFFIIQRLTVLFDGDEIKKTIVPKLCDILSGEHELVQHELISKYVQFLNYSIKV